MAIESYGPRAGETPPAVLCIPGARFGSGAEFGEVVEMLMTAYMSAEQGRTLEWKPAGLETFVPAVAKGTWKPGA